MDTIVIRKPIAAGKFYPADPVELKKLIHSLSNKKPRGKNVTGCILPHAGYIYSGKVAIETILELTLKKNIILLGPNHTGYGHPFSIMAAGSWQTPLGHIKINSLFARRLMSKIPELHDDNTAHTYEHSLEVEIPLLQYFTADFSIVPITISSNSINALTQLGKNIACVIEESGLKESTLIIASSDMTHYESKDSAQKKDSIAIKAILNLDESQLMDKIIESDISMCGYMPAIAMIAACKALGANKAELVKYQTSAEATHDDTSVVGYAGIIVY